MRRLRRAFFLLFFQNKNFADAKFVGSLYRLKSAVPHPLIFCIENNNKFTIKIFNQYLKSTVIYGTKRFKKKLKELI